MSTNSLIASSVTKRVIYCNFDGYPEGVGRTLKDHYNDPEKIEKLMDLGDISALGSDIEEYTIVHGRDRKETGTQARSFNNENDLYNRSDIEYIYLWNGQEWTYSNVFESKSFSVLAI